MTDSRVAGYQNQQVPAPGARTKHTRPQICLRHTARIRLADGHLHTITLVQVHQRLLRDLQLNRFTPLHPQREQFPCHLHHLGGALSEELGLDQSPSILDFRGPVWGV